LQPDAHAAPHASQFMLQTDAQSVSCDIDVQYMHLQSWLSTRFFSSGLPVLKNGVSYVRFWFQLRDFYFFRIFDVEF
jgi:hypothetical protein